MRIIVTHSSPDWDAITSVWLLKRFLPGWENAVIQFVPAGQRVGGRGKGKGESDYPIEIIDGKEVIHVDTGMGPLDHHQTADLQVCAASKTWEYVRNQNPEFSIETEKWEDRKHALQRIIDIIVAIDHFQEVYWENSTADYHEFSLLGLLEGLKIEKPNNDQWYVDIGMECLDAELHNFENRIWAEKEMKDKGKIFETRFGKGIAFETLNDTVLKLAQKIGYAIVIRKDPRKGYVRIKVKPKQILPIHTNTTNKKNMDIDLTSVYENLKEMDSKATWFLHVSKKMLLNGTPKNPKMIPTTLSLNEIIKVVEKV